MTAGCILKIAGSQVKHSRGSPLEAAVEATPESTPYVTPIKVTFSLINNNICGLFNFGCHFVYPRMISVPLIKSYFHKSLHRMKSLNSQGLLCLVKSVVICVLRLQITSHPFCRVTTTRHLQRFRPLELPAPGELIMLNSGDKV